MLFIMKMECFIVHAAIEFTTNIYVYKNDRIQDRTNLSKSLVYNMVPCSN